MIKLEKQTTNLVSNINISGDISQIHIRTIYHKYYYSLLSFINRLNVKNSETYRTYLTYFFINYHELGNLGKCYLKFLSSYLLYRHEFFPGGWRGCLNMFHIPGGRDCPYSRPFCDMDWIRILILRGFIFENSYFNFKMNLSSLHILR